VANEYINERKLQDRIHYLVGDVGDRGMMEGLGKFDLVYSTFSLHHWKDPKASISNLWNTVKDKGTLFIHDFKRVWWLCFLPLRGGEIGSIRASYTPKEIKAILQELGIINYKIKTLFPFSLQSIIACK
jgi:2-polyprenyl-3-methyl-5-hydroxy-6-metoxy-1,4-benzoquinol methylase